MGGSDQKRAILAVILSGIILFAWQFYMGDAEKPLSKNNQVVESNSTQSLKDSNSEKVIDKDKADEMSTESIEAVSIIELSNDKAKYTLDSLLSIKDAHFPNEARKFKNLFEQKNNNSVEFFIAGSFKKVFFTFTNIKKDSVSILNKKFGITGVVFIDEKGFINFNLNSKEPLKYRFNFLDKKESLSMVQTRNFALYSNDLEVINVGDDEQGDKKLSWAGLDFDYHVFFVVFDKPDNFIYKTTELNNLNVSSSNLTTQVSYKYLFARKEYDSLKNLGHNLELSVDFGMWSLLAVPILRGLQFFYSLFPNYGISIILLTLLIRMLTFPLQYKSFKSMKKMQQVQPEISKIREKFKDDPQRMQQETMALFKSAGANPLGGCLPLLLQMPIFFAFYKVLYSSVELVGAPFYVWITDLSVKDPYYVLPILMAVSMFLQQKLTPTTTADPVQKKIMLFMPLIFGIFMKDLPAGLTLYIFVSTVFGMIQQLFVYKRT